LLCRSTLRQCCAQQKRREFRPSQFHVMYCRREPPCEEGLRTGPPVHGTQGDRARQLHANNWSLAQTKPSFFQSPPALPEHIAQASLGCFRHRNGNSITIIPKVIIHIELQPMPSYKGPSPAVQHPRPLYSVSE
jgi:hypothetical protein